MLSRRRSMMQIFSEWAAFIPWASLPTFNTDGRNLWTANRMSDIVRCIPDVLQFQYELSNRRGVERTGDHEEESPAAENSPSPVWWTSIKSRKRPRGETSAQRMISLLLQPTHANKLPHFDPEDSPEDVQERLSRIELQVLYGADNHQSLSRLQALALERGGAENIADDELFEPGELEGYHNSIDDAILLGANHPEWDVIKMHEVGRDQSGRRGKKRVKAKRTKADKVPTQVSYSDEDDPTYDDEEESNASRHTGSRLSPREGGEGDNEDGFFLGKDAYLGFGLFPGWEGDDPDTVRYFGEGMEEI